jgi:alginate O-acetyltransferase complex protein AlgI
LFGAGFFIYFSWVELGGAVAAACIFIFLWESIFSRLYRPASRWCIAGVIQAIVILVVFKYWNFFVDSALGQGNSLRWTGIFLPLGISFFTFEFIHYAVDRHQNKTEPGRLDEYLAFILFFPTMVAGPIKRFQDFLPKLRNPSTDTALDWRVGTTRILAGLVKKFAVADFLTSLTNHLNPQDIPLASKGLLIVWLFAYGWKIYFDFSAYSDIAIGSARLFGIKVPENFDWPYFRTNIAEFWKHWHISLYRWLVDYIFIPLGGSRVALPLIYRNILLTMLLSGLWHGAGFHFLIWGLWHGILLVIHRLWSQTAWGQKTPGSFGKAWRIFLTYVAVNFGWAFFCMDYSTAILFFKRLLF